MLHKFFEGGYWFKAKKFGYGSGLPIAWQGWVLLIGHTVLLVGLVLLIEYGGFAAKVVAILGIILSTMLVLLIAKHRTEGGWKWRS